MNVFSATKHLISLVLTAVFLLPQAATAMPASTKTSHVRSHHLETRTLVDSIGLFKFSTYIFLSYSSLNNISDMNSLAVELYKAITRIALSKNNIPTQFESNELILYRNAPHILSSLITSMVGRKITLVEIIKFTKRPIQLSRSLLLIDRKFASDIFDMRLKYAQQKFDVQQLKLKESLSNEREAVEKEERRFINTVAFFSIVLLIILVSLSMLQRRNNKQLKLVIAQLHDAERALQASESRMRAITNNIPAVIAQIDKDQRYVFANAHTGKILGLDPKLLIGKTLREARGEESYIEVQPYIEEVLLGKRVRFERSSLLAGKLYYYQSNYVPEFDENQNIKGFLALTYDITALKLAEANLDRLTRIDSLTGVANRRQFDEQLSAALARSRRQESAITLLYLDIDNFKTINDTHGHLVGDSVIIAFAERLQSCVRKDDLLARLGGDEFVVLIENPTPESGETMARKLLLLMQQPVQIDEIILPLSASIGVAYCTLTPDAKALMNLADQALYDAKAAGRNTFRANVS